MTKNANEIRKLAEDKTLKAFVSDGPASVIVTKKVRSALLAHAKIQETLDRIGDLGDSIEALADEIKLADQSSQRRMVELTVQQAMQLLCAIYDRQKILERCMMYRKAFSAYPELHKTDIAMLDDIEKGSKDGNE